MWTSVRQNIQKAIFSKKDHIPPLARIKVQSAYGVIERPSPIKKSPPAAEQSILKDISV
jgi:hypothetical protein